MSASRVAALHPRVSTRERLLIGAQQVIEEAGYGAASVIAIADHAGVATGTLYRHFDSKEELFVEVFRSVCSREERVIRAAASALGPRASAVERIEVMLATFAERALRNPRLAWALIAEPVDRLVEVERLAYRGRYARAVAEDLRAAIAAGEAPAQDADLTAAALVGGCGEALVGPLSPLTGQPPVPGEVVAALRIFVRRAVGAEAAARR